MPKRYDNGHFLATFARLKEETDDDPKQLCPLGKLGQEIQRLCEELHRSAEEFQAFEERSPVAMARHISPASVKARREYEERWAEPVSSVAWRWLLLALEKQFPVLSENDEEAEEFPKAKQDPLADRIEDWKYDSKGWAREIERAFDEIFELSGCDTSGEYEWVEGSLRAWDRLRGAGLDVADALWRRRAIPFVLVPQHVANRYGKEHQSLYLRLHQAAKAFIFGAPLAALALQRAVLEEVLKKHWGSEKGHIRDACLPELSWDSRADRLKNLANKALHGEPEKLKPARQDRAIIENFLLLRLLIERSPEQSARKNT